MNFLLLTCAFWSAAYAQPTAPVRPVDRIVAVVEESVILQSELDSATARIVGQFEAANRDLPPREVLQKQILEQLIMIELQLQRAVATGMRVSEEEIDRGIDRVASQAGITPDQMRQSITADGLSWGEFRQEMGDEILTSRLRQRIGETRVNVSETEIDVFLASNQRQSGEYRISHILIGVPEGASPAAVEESRVKADQVRAELDQGMDFATAAITYSDGQQALQGGDLGWRVADQIPLVFSEMVASMERGDISRPVRSPSGFHLIKLVDVRAESTRMVEEFNAQHIMVEINELMSATEALNLINSLHDRLQSGEDFGELARKFSDDISTANLGGDMGWFQPDAFGPRVGETLASLDDGELSQPFQSQAGWHILRKVGERREDRTEELVRAQARENLRQQKAQEEVELFLRQMRDEAFVEYRV